jgi:hypothetical protein
LRGDTQPPDEKSLNAYRVGAREGADRYFEAFLQADLLAGVRNRPAVRERMRLMMTDNFKALAYLAPGTLLYPATPTIRRLGDIHAPTLVMIGSLDSPSLRHIADTIASKVPGARKVTIEGASHHPPVETPQECNRALLRFLRSFDFVRIDWNWPETCCSANCSTARETAFPGNVHSAGQVRDLAWTRPCNAVSRLSRATRRSPRSLPQHVSGLRTEADLTKSN